MKLKHKIIATLKSLPTILTFRRYYFCEECHKLHKFTGNEFPVYGGWWEKYTYCNVDCSNQMIKRVQEMLFRDAFESIKRKGNV